MKMCDMKVGDIAAVTFVGGSGREKTRLLDLGFVRGTYVTAVGRAPGGDPMEINLRGYNLALRRSSAALIEVVPIGKAAAN